jgi:hypothetical protein
MAQPRSSLSGGIVRVRAPLAFATTPAMIGATVPSPAKE